MAFSDEVVKHHGIAEMTRAFVLALNEILNPRSITLYLRSPNLSELACVYTNATNLPPVLPEEPWAKTLCEKSALAMKQGSINNGDGLIGDLGVEAARWGIEAVIPILSHGELLGLLCLGGKQSDERYTVEDLVVLRTLTNQAAAAFERPKLLREISGGFAHEIKTPLAAIALPAELSYLELEGLSRKDQRLDEILPKLRLRLKYIIEQTFVASQRVDALQAMVFSSPENNSRLELCQAVKSALQTLKIPLEESQINVEVDVGENQEIDGDPKQLEIVFTNLIKNAIDALNNVPLGARRIKITSAAVGSFWRLLVQDSGNGISPDKHKKIFEPYFSTKESRGNRGMGLYLTRQIIRLHHGTIAVANNGESGTCFVITFPLPHIKSEAAEN